MADRARDDREPGPEAPEHRAQRRFAHTLPRANRAATVPAPRAPTDDREEDVATIAMLAIPRLARPGPAMSPESDPDYAVTIAAMPAMSTSPAEARAMRPALPLLYGQPSPAAGTPPRPTESAAPDPAAPLPLLYGEPSAPATPTPLPMHSAQLPLLHGERAPSAVAPLPQLHHEPNTPPRVPSETSIPSDATPLPLLYGEPSGPSVATPLPVLRDEPSAPRSESIAPIAHRPRATSAPSLDAPRLRAASIPPIDSQRQRAASIPSIDSQRQRAASIPSIDSQHQRAVNAPALDSQRQRAIHAPALDSQRQRAIHAPALDSQRQRRTPAPAGTEPPRPRAASAPPPDTLAPRHLEPGAMSITSPLPLPLLDDEPSEPASSALPVEDTGASAHGPLPVLGDEPSVMSRQADTSALPVPDAFPVSVAPLSPWPAGLVGPAARAARIARGSRVFGLREIVSIAIAMMLFVVAIWLLHAT